MVFDMFHESIQDNLDLFGHLAMESDGKEQLKYKDNFEKFYDFLGEDGHLDYGRINTRHCMLRETVDLTVGLILLNPDEADADADALAAEYSVGPLDSWSRNDWKQCKQGLIELRDIVIKKGAVAGINEANDTGISQDRDSKSKRYNIAKVCRGLDVCAVLAPLRSALKAQLVGSTKKGGSPKRRTTPKRGTPKVKRSIISDFHKEIENLEDPNLMNVLKQLVVEDETSGDLKMKDIDTLREVLVDNAQLSVKRIATKTLEKLKSWNKDMFPEPRLYSMYFGEDEEDSEDEPEEEEEEEEDDEEDTEAQDAAVQTLRTSRARLMESVDDPLAEAVAAAANASTPGARKRAVSKTLQTQSAEEEDREEDERRKPAGKNSSSKKRKRQGESLLKKKKSATKLSFDDDDDDDDEDIPDPSEDSTLLSELPAKAAAAKSSRKTPNKSPKRSQIKSYAGRRVWTDQEKRAVKEGIRLFGLGKWAEIKDYYEVVLQYRTSTQIKDCYRTMAKRNELGDVLDTE